jgi:hypothetical protein
VPPSAVGLSQLKGNNSRALDQFQTKTSRVLAIKQTYQTLKEMPRSVGTWAANPVAGDEIGMARSAIAA